MPATDLVSRFRPNDLRRLQARGAAGVVATIPSLGFDLIARLGRYMIGVHPMTPPRRRALHELVQRVRETRPVFSGRSHSKPGQA